MPKLKLHKKQGDIVKNILKRKAKYHVINASRQSGKSYLALMLLIYFANNEQDKEIMFVSPIHKQNKKVYLKLKQALLHLDNLDSSNGSDLDIYTKNGNHIQFRSAERYDNIRGESVDILFCDEFSFIRKDAWESAIRPVTSARKEALVIITSTPKGQNLFYDLCLLGMDESNPRYEYYKMMYYDNPHYDTEEVEDARKTLPENIFKTEYLAEFIAEGVVFRKIKEACVLDDFSETGSRFYGGLDFGQADDYTVLTILNEFGETVALHRTNKKSFKDIENEVLPILQKYNPIVYVESNLGTINAPLYESLIEKYSNLYPFQTNNSTKNDIIENLNLSMDEEAIKLPSKNLNRNVEFELTIFEYQYSVKTRKILYSAPTGLHDDIVISIALANKCFRENRNNSNNSVWITEERDNRW